MKCLPRLYKNNLYSLNQVKPCNVAPENIEMSCQSKDVRKPFSNRDQRNHMQR